ncbi:MAG: dihydrofolate reductase family protein [Georgenia sp.]
MGTIAVHEFIALDGQYEDPSWTFEYGFDPKMGETLEAITSGATAILLGRKTYEMFAPAWSRRTVEDDPGAPFFNDTHKYVVASREPDVTWGPSTRLPYPSEAIGALKEGTGGTIYVSVSGTLVRAPPAGRPRRHLHLFVYPVARGAGERLFEVGGPPTMFALKGHDRYDNGVVHLNYGRG